MPSLQSFFAANFIVIYFGTGLIFLLMGFGAAVAVRTFRDSSLALARHLPLLAGFGLLWGVAQWGVIFIPLQASYLGEPALTALLLLQTGIMALAHACLFAFGARLVATTIEARWLHRLVWLPPALFVAGLTWYLLAGRGFTLGAELAAWRLEGQRWSAYLMGLPGALLSAWGVLAQRRELARYYPRAAWFLYGTALAFILLVPLSPRNLPVMALDQLVTPELAHFSTVLGIPVQVFLGLDGLMLAYFTMQALEVFRRENSRRLEASERREAALEERYRIGRQLNDDVLQDLMGVGMVLESVQLSLDGDAADLRESLRLAHLQQGRIAERIRAFMMEIEPMDWEIADVSEGFRRLIEEFRTHTLIPVQVHLDPSTTPAPAVLPHLYVTAQEALTNIRRHALASRVRITLHQSNGHVVLRIRDNGRGIPAGVSDGPGLSRMRQAAAAAGGELAVQALAGGGTEVVLRLSTRTYGS